MLQHGFGHAVREGGASGQICGDLLRFAKQVGRFVNRVEKSPGKTLLRRHRTACEQKFTRPALSDHAWKQRAGAHVGACQAHAGEQEGGFGRRAAKAQVARQRHHRSRARANAVNRADDRLRAVAHAADQVAGHAGELQHLGHRHLGQWPDDFMHVTTTAKVAASAGDDDHFHVAGELQRVEQIAQLCVGVKR